MFSGAPWLYLHHTPTLESLPVTFSAKASVSILRTYIFHVCCFCLFANSMVFFPEGRISPFRAKYMTVSWKVEIQYTECLILLLCHFSSNSAAFCLWVPKLHQILCFLEIQYFLDTHFTIISAFSSITDNEVQHIKLCLTFSFRR